MSLYTINEQLLACTDQETGEIIDTGLFTSLQMEREDKLESIALWHKSLLAEAEMYKAEKTVFYEREKQAKSKADSLKKYLDTALAGKKFNTSKVAISYRKSSTLEYDGTTKVLDKYLVAQEPTIDKMAVKTDLKAGETIDGFEIVDHNNISIK